jgi:hypothetical protein
MAEEVVVTVETCEVKKKVLAMAWTTLKKFFHGRARDKKEKELNHSKIQIRIRHGGENIWIDEQQIDGIRVNMSIWR